ncbi:copper resistance CopC family protein [Solirubrobacter soli]|uniref:copper resistance CopC family protein n=1 Tax=Solirubrobacter soli TaxID=363832 RepID=UPI00040A9180|nr:copper resistance protein CopC [Solirubrobacter soli]
MRNRLIAATAVAVIALPSALAWAHAEVKSRTPRNGSTVHHSVSEVHITFSEAVITGKLSITKGGSTVALKSTGLKPSNHAIVQGIPKRPLSKGSYTVNWRALADDGHHQKGSWTFKVD